MSKAPLTTTQLRRVWGPPCAVNLTRYTFQGGATVSIDTRILQAVAALDAIMVNHGYRPRAADTGAYVCRRITGGTGYSLHAYGIAIDINWQTNPYSAANRTVTDMPAGMVDEITALRTESGAPVWGWGGNYRTIKDTMHYEIVCTPADLATGITGASTTGEINVADLMEQIKQELVNQDERAKAREERDLKIVTDRLEQLDDKVGEAKRMVRAVGKHSGMTDAELTAAAKPEKP